MLFSIFILFFNLFFKKTNLWSDYQINWFNTDFLEPNNRHNLIIQMLAKKSQKRLFSWIDCSFCTLLAGFSLISLIFIWRI